MPDLRPPEHAWFESYRPGPDGRSFRFSDPADAIEVWDTGDVPAALARVEQAVAGGWHAVGWLSYESAPAFDPALAVQAATGSLPLAWFGLYRAREPIEPGSGPTGPYELGDWLDGWDESQHATAVAQARQLIGAGDIYQVNLTYPVHATFSGSAAGLYRDLCQSQGNAAFCAFLDLGDVALLSTSPELFVSMKGDVVRTRPMKGTRPRGLWSAHDDALRDELLASPKDRAENLMIVDLLRNDLGRIARPGTVQVTSMWDVEQYDTVWQMTSSVSARARADVGLQDLFGALFPCGSVTGAPKVRASQIIDSLEGSPRGVYTGSIGFVSPEDAVFNVAIRTVVIERQPDRQHHLACAGVGGGIVWDSHAATEYDECQTKRAFLHPRNRDDDAFSLFETLLFEPDTGYYLVARHLQRLAASARYFGFACDIERAREALESTARQLTEPTVVRLALHAADGFSVETRAPRPPAQSLSAVLASRPVDAGDVWLYHKTTHRQSYELAMAEADVAGAQEVVLRNLAGELTECSVGNLVVEQGERRWTPPVACGLLPGTQRAQLLSQGQIEERVLTVDDLWSADAVYRINSVRPWVRLEMLPEPLAASGATKEDNLCIK